MKLCSEYQAKILKKDNLGWLFFEKSLCFGTVRVWRTYGTMLYVIVSNSNVKAQISVGKTIDSLTRTQLGKTLRCVSRSRARNASKYLCRLRKKYPKINIRLPTTV